MAALGQAAVTQADFWRARDLWQRAEAGGTTTAMVFNYRFFDQTQKARALIAALDLGAPVHFSGLVHYACWSHVIDLVLGLYGARSDDQCAGGFARRALYGQRCCAECECGGAYGK